MKKSLMRFLFGALLATVSLAVSARAQSNVVFAVEFNQSNNRFGTIDLWNGNFTLITNIGGTLINDLAYCPTNGMLYGIVNSTTLVTFNKTTGAITNIGNFNASIQSLAFRYSDGVLFGATQTGLYIINTVTGAATLVGSFGSPRNLGTQGQNIRFAQDGNLYVSNTSANTDIYRINTTNGVATWMGEAVGIPYLMLMNGDNYMYGVYISLGSSSGPQNILASFDLTSFVAGGTNADGSTHQISIAMVGAGTNFPINFIFSGSVSPAVTNLAVPVSAVGPSNQTAVVGSPAVFSTVASGTGPYNYAWSKNGTALNGQTNSSLTLNNVTTNDAATYSVIVGGELGTVTNSATLTVAKALGAYRITATTATPSPGVGDGLTIKLVNQDGNVLTSFSGDTNLTFSGLSLAGNGTHPTVTDKNGTAVALGTPTTIAFVNGQSSAGGTLVAYKGEGPVTLNATDGSSSTTNTGGAGVSLTIPNLAPVANPVSYTRSPGAGIRIFVSDLLANDTDANGDTLSYVSCVSPTVNGVSLRISGSENSTRITYPSSATNIADSFQYTISDGNGGTATGTVSITLIMTTGQQATISVSGAQAGMTTPTVTLTFYGVPGYHYVVQREAVFGGNWADITVTTSSNVSIDNSNGYSVITAPTAGAFTVTDPSPPESSAYYRLRSAP